MAEKEMLSSSTESVESPLDSPSLSPLADEKKLASSSTRSSSLSTALDHTDSIQADDEDDALDIEKRLSRHVSRSIGEPIGRTQTGVSIATHATTDPAFEIDW